MSIVKIRTGLELYKSLSEEARALLKDACEFEINTILESAKNDSAIVYKRYDDLTLISQLTVDKFLEIIKIGFHSNDVKCIKSSANLSKNHHFLCAYHKEITSFLLGELNKEDTHATLIENTLVDIVGYQKPLLDSLGLSIQEYFIESINSHLSVEDININKHKSWILFVINSTEKILSLNVMTDAYMINHDQIKFEKSYINFSYTSINTLIEKAIDLLKILSKIGTSEVLIRIADIIANPISINLSNYNKSNPEPQCLFISSIFYPILSWYNEIISDQENNDRLLHEIYTNIKWFISHSIPCLESHLDSKKTSTIKTHANELKAKIISIEHFQIYMLLLYSEVITRDDETTSQRFELIGEDSKETQYSIVTSLIENTVNNISKWTKLLINFGNSPADDMAWGYILSIYISRLADEYPKTTFNLFLNLNESNNWENNNCEYKKALFSNLLANILQSNKLDKKSKKEIINKIYQLTNNNENLSIIICAFTIHRKYNADTHSFNIIATDKVKKYPKLLKHIIEKSLELNEIELLNMGVSCLIVQPSKIFINEYCLDIVARINEKHKDETYSKLSWINKYYSKDILNKFISLLSEEIIKSLLININSLKHMNNTAEDFLGEALIHFPKITFKYILSNKQIEGCYNLYKTFYSLESKEVGELFLSNFELEVNTQKKSFETVKVEMSEKKHEIYFWDYMGSLYWPSVSLFRNVYSALFSKREQMSSTNTSTNEMFLYLKNKIENNNRNAIDFIICVLDGLFQDHTYNYKYLYKIYLSLWENVQDLGTLKRIKLSLVNMISASENHGLIKNNEKLIEQIVDWIKQVGDKNKLAFEQLSCLKKNLEQQTNALKQERDKEIAHRKSSLKY